jgi:hypothetical protein
MTNFVQLINETADRFEQIIENNTRHLQEIPTQDFGWSNQRWQSLEFRLAHVERFQQPQFAVLHTVIFPHITDPSPIFGFDIIASEKKATGLFFDLSPTVDPTEPFCDMIPREPRDRPSWGTIFSKHWIACRPSYEEAEILCNTACDVLKTYLKNLTKSSAHLHQIVHAQNNYSLQQRQNEHTTRVIKKILGEVQGSYFIENILFPTIF